MPSLQDAIGLDDCMFGNKLRSRCHWSVVPRVRFGLQRASENGFAKFEGHRDSIWQTLRSSIQLDTLTFLPTEIMQTWFPPLLARPLEHQSLNPFRDRADSIWIVSVHPVIWDRPRGLHSATGS